MGSRNQADAFRAYISPLRAALGCVTQSPLVLQGHTAASNLEVGSLYSAAVNKVLPVRLGSSLNIALTVGQTFRLEVANDRADQFIARTITYVYSILASPAIEILTFQWTSEATNSVTFPHLHVGRAVVSDKTLVMPERFHKIHVPTGHVTLAAVARLAIEEFRVKPLTRRWRDVLARAEEAELASSSG